MGNREIFNSILAVFLSLSILSSVSHATLIEAPRGHGQERIARQGTCEHRAWTVNSPSFPPLTLSTAHGMP